MAEDALYEKISKKGGLTAGDPQEETEPINLLQKLRSRITKAVQIKVDSILGDVQKLSDYDKLYLYLQLPPGPSGPDKSLDVGCVTTAEHMHACTWIRNHLEEHTDTCLPKQDVYDAYKRYCDNLCGRPLSVANFGKIIREIFPNIKARRLGGRGQSKYCYSGLRRKSMVSMPPLPSLDLKMTESSELTDLVQSYNNDVINASCALICNWAEKILKRSFNNVVEVAQFLIQQHIINPRSANAELVLSMVLSENAQSGGQKLQKQPAEAPGMKRPPSPDNSTADNKKKTPPNTHPASPPQVKKRPPEPQKAASSPQVDALVAKLPVLRPRLPTEDKFVSSSPPVRFAPPVLASNLLPGHLKVSPLPFAAVPPGVPLAVTTAGMNGAGLVSQPLAQPVISMLLPDVVSLESHVLPKVSQNGIKELAGGAAESRAAKRPAASCEEGQSKRKRGRPRKVDPQLIPGKGPLPSAAQPGRVAAEAPSATQIGDNAQEAVSSSEPPATITQETDSAAPLTIGDQIIKSELEEPLSPSLTAIRRVDVPNQVSVIQDGRQSSVQWTVRTAEQRGNREEASPQAESEWIRVQVE
ncbi:PREDICTED: DNA-binding protein RFX5 [Nanorana parkeri]|uniref:DNA-binding protein RFX5 n=1 Tax=Nanorana parkeri TaxID=125878 RepID=UPI000854177B|nr:PREDICTED: DNA-binding protein RFX5 [Nanorana parkeri]